MVEGRPRRIVAGRGRADRRAGRARVAASIAPARRSRLIGLIAGPVIDADPAVAQADQMLDRVGARRGVVDMDAGDAEVGAVFATVDDRRGGALARQQRREAVGQAVAEEDQPVDFAARQHVGILLLDLRIVARVADARPNSRRRRAASSAPRMTLREERVGDVRHGQQDLGGAQRPQACVRRRWARSRASRTTSSTRRRVASATCSGRLRTRETVAVETPASRGHFDDRRHQPVMYPVVGTVDLYPM